MSTEENDKDLCPKCGALCFPIDRNPVKKPKLWTVEWEGSDGCFLTDLVYSAEKPTMEQILKVHPHIDDSLTDEIYKIEEYSDIPTIGNGPIPAELEKPDPLIVVHVHGGNVQDVMISGDPARTDFRLIDDDNLKAEGKTNDEIEAEWNHATKGLKQLF